MKTRPWFLIPAFACLAVLGTSCATAASSGKREEVPAEKPFEVMTLDQMLSQGAYDSTDENVDEIHFVVNKARFNLKGARVFEYSKLVTKQEVDAEIEGAKCEPAPIEALLAYGAAHPDEQRQVPIIATGSLWMDPIDPRRLMPGLYGDRLMRVVLLVPIDGPDGLSKNKYRFLGVCPSDAS